MTSIVPSPPRVSLPTFATPSPFTTLRPIAPFPGGWYAVLPSDELAPGEVRGFQLADRKWVAFRTERGVAKVAFNRCSHLGGQFDRAGHVVGEQLACGLHGYRFGIDGRPAGRHPRACPLKRSVPTLPTVEHHGMIFIWYAEGQAPPAYELPKLDDAAWRPWSFRSLDVQTQPALIMQDLADTLHFETVHRYTNIRIENGPRYDGHRMDLEVAFDWDTGLPGRFRDLPMRFHSQCHGLGYQLTEVSCFAGLFQTRHLVLPTPLDPHTTRIHLGTTVRWHGRIGERVGRAFADALSQRYIDWAFLRDVTRDARLWEQQSRHLRPSLAPDPVIHEFRTWAKGFTQP